MMAQKLLVVDFEENLLEYFQSLLSDHGYEAAGLLAERSMGCKEGLVEQIRSLQPDLVIIEPCALQYQKGTDGEQHRKLLPIGLESVELLRRFSNVPVMYLGWSYRGYTEDDPDGKAIFQRMLDTHPVALINKPFMPSAFLVNVDLALRFREDDLLPSDAGSPNHDTRITRQLLRASQELQQQAQYGEGMQREAELHYERLDAIFNCVSDPIFLKDREMKYSMVNPAMAKLLDRPPADIIGKLDGDFFDPEVVEHFQELDSRVLKGEIIEEEHTRTIGGEAFTFLDSRSPIKNVSGEVIGICGVSRSITERHRLSPERIVIDHEYASPAMRACLERARVAAVTDSIVLLLGESGSGKDHVSRYIHKESKRANGPFFTINCAALPPELAESELFGHERGAFTGARGQKRGLLELAEGGTLLLNESGELSPTLQSKLLTFLDTRSFTRVGGEKPITVNARLIAATNRDLAEEVKRRGFRQDLFYRLNVLQIKVPSLRERIEDIPILVRELLSKLGAEMNLKSPPVVVAKAMEKLQRHAWPGNVRELRNVLERAIINPHGSTITVDEIDFGSEVNERPESEPPIPPPLTPLSHLSDMEFEQMYEEVCVRFDEKAGKELGEPGSATAIGTILGCRRETVGRRLSRLECPKVSKSGLSQDAMADLIRRLEDWLTRHGFDLGRAPR